MLPVSPIGAGNSPYDTPSSFAGNPLLISLELLVQDGLLEPRELGAPHALVTARRALFGAARRFRSKRLRRAFERFAGNQQLGWEFSQFRERNQHWLPGYALFSALKQKLGPAPWTSW